MLWLKCKKLSKYSKLPQTRIYLGNMGIHVQIQIKMIASAIFKDTMDRENGQASKKIFKNVTKTVYQQLIMIG